jgi:hypothetical protein
MLLCEGDVVLARAETAEDFANMDLMRRIAGMNG